MGAVTARGLGGALVALLLGALLGIGGAYATRPDPDAAGLPAPVPAESPSVPTDAPYDPDIDWPTLSEEFDELDRYRIDNNLKTWEYAVPAGWVAYRVPSGIIAPPEDVPDYDEMRFRPEGEPDEGGFSLRVKVIDNHKAPSDEILDKIAGMERAYTDLDVIEQTQDAVYFRFRDSNNRLRYNFFRWFVASPATEATLEMSVAGRQQDEPGLRALFDLFAEEAEPVVL